MPSFAIGICRFAYAHAFLIICWFFGFSAKIIFLSGPSVLKDMVSCLSTVEKSLRTNKRHGLRFLTRTKRSGVGVSLSQLMAEEQSLQLAPLAAIMACRELFINPIQSLASHICELLAGGRVRGTRIEWTGTYQNQPSSRPHWHDALMGRFSHHSHAAHTCLPRHRWRRISGLSSQKPNTVPLHFSIPSLILWVT